MKAKKFIKSLTRKWLSLSILNPFSITYKLLRIAWREAHGVTGFRLVVEVGATLKEAEHAVEEWVETASFLRHRHEHLVELRE